MDLDWKEVLQAAQDVEFQGPAARTEHPDVSKGIEQGSGFFPPLLFDHVACWIQQQCGWAPYDHCEIVRDV